MRVALATCYYYPNYGSMLQAYATQQAVKKVGCDTVTLQTYMPIHYLNQSKVRYYFHKVTTPAIVKTHIRQFRGRLQERKYPEVEEGIRTRLSYFKRFSKEFFDLSELMENRADLTDYTGNYDCVLVGSDQLWSPANVEHDLYTLSFVPDNVKKVSYATSIGTTDIPSYQLAEYKKFLSRFAAISVREKSAVELINNLGIHADPKLVLDPTLLFTGDEWLSIQREESIISEPYILCYFLGTNRWHRSFAKHLSQKYGCKIVSLQQLDEFYESDVTFGDYRPYDVGPAEFVNLIRNARFVCTDSFHGTCFSILNHKQFFTMNRFQNSEKLSTNTRIDSLLSLLGLEDRRIADIEGAKVKLKSKDPIIDYTNVDRTLDSLRVDSYSFLNKALGIMND